MSGSPTQICGWRRLFTTPLMKPEFMDSSWIWADLNPLEISEILGSTVKDQFSNPFSECTETMSSLSSFFVPLQHGTSCNCPQTLGFSRVHSLWPGSWPLVASQPGTNQFRQYLESTIVWRNLPLYHRFQDFALSFQAKRAWQSESKHLKRFKRHVASDHCWHVILSRPHRAAGDELIGGREP